MSVQCFRSWYNVKMAFEARRRLKYCRRFKHGLSQSPQSKNAAPKGSGSLLPCPTDEEGCCPYRRPYRCSNTIQAGSRVVGHCLIEQFVHDRLMRSALELLGAGDWDELDDEQQRLACLWLEAIVYQRRVLAYAGMRQTGEVTTPSHANVLRYLTSAMNAASSRLDELLAENPLET